VAQFDRGRCDQLPGPVGHSIVVAYVSIRSNIAVWLVSLKLLAG